MKRWSKVLDTVTNREGIVQYVYTCGDHADVLLDGQSTIQLVRVSDLEVL